MHAVSTLLVQAVLLLCCTHPIANITEEPVIPSTCPQGSPHTPNHSRDELSPNVSANGETGRAFIVLAGVEPEGRTVEALNAAVVCSSLNSSEKIACITAPCVPYIQRKHLHTTRRP